MRNSSSFSVAWRRAGGLAFSLRAHTNRVVSSAPSSARSLSFSAETQLPWTHPRMSALGRSPFLPLPVSSGRLWGEGRSGVTHRRLGKTAGKGNPVVAYRIVVHTGDLRCAGTEEKLYLELHGMEGSSDRLVFSQVSACVRVMRFPALSFRVVRSSAGVV